MGTPIAKPSPPPKYWPLAQHVLCFECKGYNYQGAVSYKTEYWSDGYEVFHSADTVVASNMEELCESYPSGGGWRMGGGYTPGFAQIARNLRVRRALLDTLYCLCFQPRIETLLDEAVMAGRDELAMPPQIAALILAFLGQMDTAPNESRPPDPCAREPVLLIESMLGDTIPLVQISHYSGGN